MQLRDTGAVGSRMGCGGGELWGWGLDGGWGVWEGLWATGSGCGMLVCRRCGARVWGVGGMGTQPWGAGGVGCWGCGAWMWKGGL